MHYQATLPAAHVGPAVDGLGAIISSCIDQRHDGSELASSVKIEHGTQWRYVLSRFPMQRTKYDAQIICVRIVEFYKRAGVKVDLCPAPTGWSATVTLDGITPPLHVPKGELVIEEIYDRFRSALEHTRAA